MASILDEQGQLHRPLVLSSPNPLLSLASLESLRTWRFKPAQCQGKPVKVYYTLTTRFTIAECYQAQKQEKD